MNSKLTQIAKASVQASEVITNHNKVTTQDIQARYPAGIHITAVDILNGKKGDYAVINFREDQNAWYGCGEILTNIVKSWIAAFEGDISAVNDALKTDSVHVVLGTKRTKNGNDLTTVEVIED